MLCCCIVVAVFDVVSIQAAKEVADFLGTVHHSYVYTVQEGLDAIREVVRMIETYDTTTIRASTPMFLMSRKIKAMGVKMVLSGEGADEASGTVWWCARRASGVQAALC